MIKTKLIVSGGIFLSAFLIINLRVCAGTTAGGNGSGAFVTGKYRNLFREIGYTEKEISQKTNAAFNQLFHGDTAHAVYFDAGKNEMGALAYVSDVLHHDVRSEGMSYGMMICVQMDKKAEFDALWNWAMTYMYVSKPDHP